jgi:tetratricopeptide (TPR) repeat protein
MTLDAALDLKKLTDLLEITQPEIIVDLKKSIMRSFNNPKAMRSIVDRQCENREQTHCYSCGNEAGCLILNGIAYLSLGETEAAIRELENANQHFRNEDETWNHIIGLALIGNAYEKRKKDHRAFREYKKAHGVIKNIFLRTHQNDYIEKAISLEKALKAKVDELNPNSPKKRGGQPTKARLSIPWMPTYSGIQAGPNGPIWSEHLPKDESIFLDQIVLEEKPYDIYSLKQGDNLIFLSGLKKYGWAKVSGNSMNAAKPIAIPEGDYVLFYESSDADNGMIVMASCPNKSGAGYQFIVKRYSRNDKLLTSETEPPDSYEPIPIKKDVKIIGVVIAVARSIETTEDHNGQPDEDTGDSENRIDRYNELVLLVRGYIDVADRLIKNEEILSPQSNRDDCIERAITRLLRDRNA